jgi:anaerobic dimethyl sulfoxide reductase subunit B (iron-sulfur subunit)
MTKQMAFYFDASACNGCKACVVACKSKNNLPTGINWRRVIEYGGGNWVPDPDEPTRLLPSNIFAYAISLACNHCQEPICMESCPTGAITKSDDGVVSIDDTKCIGCRYCEWSCPYGAPQFDAAAGVMTKCNFCEDLLQQGETPYCVAACVMRAMDFGDLEELRAKYGNVDAIEPLPAAKLTSPSLVITPHPHAQMSGEGTGKIVATAEEG